MALKENRYRITLDDDWSLEDLYVFPRSYEQVYYLYYSLMPQEDEEAIERIRNAYSVFPWRGGYSAVNFYNQLKYVVPPRSRPAVGSIRYGSPGLLELMLIAAIAWKIEEIVKAIASSIEHANNIYSDIQRGLQKRKLLRLEIRRKELQLEKEELRYVEHCLGRMAQLLGFENVAEMNSRTGSPYKTLKILLSFYRRIRTLAGYQIKGKIRL